MDRFPFDQLLTFLVFLIIALSQIWTKLREQKKQKEKSLHRKITSSPSRPRTLEKKLPQPVNDLLEALGIPPHELTPPPIQKSPSLPPPRVETKKIPTPSPRVAKVKSFLPSTPQPVLITKIKEGKITPRPILENLPSNALHQKLKQVLSDRKQIQQAILLNEILSPPKALSSDFP
ncbi:MAG: hypothetical protein K1X66_09355 [Verrucomicrobiae bacterium]|nr:hypothetical protein [Verrucomicrobiae bacterium]